MKIIHLLLIKLFKKINKKAILEKLENYKYINLFYNFIKKNMKKQEILILNINRII